MTFFIKFRKKYLLPLKWRRKRNKLAKEVVMPAPHELLDLKDTLIEKLREYERTEQEDRINFVEGQIEILDWLLNN